MSKRELRESGNDGIIKLTETTRALIRSEEINKVVNIEKQNRHIRGKPEYTAGRSYIFGDASDAQALVDEYHGKGTPMFDKNGKWKNKEVIKALKDIGVNIKPGSAEQQWTNRFVIHYSKTGTHIVPTNRED